MKIGIDWGGTKIEGIVLDPQTKNEILRKRVDSPKENYKEQRPGIIMGMIYMNLLKKIRQAKFDVFEKKISLNPIEKVLTFISNSLCFFMIELESIPPDKKLATSTSALLLINTDDSKISKNLFSSYFF